MDVYKMLRFVLWVGALNSSKFLKKNPNESWKGQKEEEEGACVHNRQDKPHLLATLWQIIRWNGPLNASWKSNQRRVKLR